MNIPVKTLTNASQIPYVTADEAYQLMSTALERLIVVLESLSPEDWRKPTACTAWDVHAMVSHQAGGFATGTGYGEMIRQYGKIPRPGQLPEDAVNEMQVAERAGKSPEQLIEEIRQKGPVAARKWAYEFRLARLVAIPHAIAGLLTMGYLNWVIHSRDTWMHRLDICRATGRPFEQTPEHDGRIVALVVRDVARQINSKLNGRALALELTGMAGGAWQIGSGLPATTLKMDALEFNIFASGRMNFEQARPLMTISGDTSLAENALRDLLILY